MSDAYNVDIRSAQNFFLNLAAGMFMSLRYFATILLARFSMPAFASSLRIWSAVLIYKLPCDVLLRLYQLILCYR
jgi:hypothetical protein